jgi:hypothetical protein
MQVIKNKIQETFIVLNPCQGCILECRSQKNHSCLHNQWNIFLFPKDILSILDYSEIAAEIVKHRLFTPVHMLHEICAELLNKIEMIYTPV